MPKNKSAVERYYVIDECLTNTMRPYPDKKFLMERINEKLDIEISKSMVDKDFANMKMIYSAPIKYSSFHKGYFYDQEGYSITKLPLTREEIDALDFSTTMLSLMKGSKLRDRCEAAIDKLIAAYRVTKAVGAKEAFIQLEEPLSTKGINWFETIIQAIIHKKCLKVEYCSFAGEKKEHLFSPYLVKEYRNRWYTIGHSNRPDKVLLLALDRIEKLEICKETFKSAVDFSPSDFFKYSFGITQFNGADPETVELQFTPYQAPYIISQPLHHSQEILENDKNKGLKMRLKVYITHELESTILGYGKEVKVLTPASLKKKIKDTAKAVAAF